MGKKSRCNHIKRATPKWADKDEIKAVYKMARRLSKITGVKHEVDHVIPLVHPYVCGLHVVENMQVMPARDNRLKGNFFYPHNVTKGFCYWQPGCD